MTETNFLGSAPATNIVGLGSRCAVAYNLRRFYNFGSAYPFDWWITPFEGLIGLLQHPDVDWLYDPELLELTARAESVRHQQLGILFHHEFPRDWEQPSCPVRSNFREFIAAPKKRTSYLLDKLLGLDNPRERILFVREGDAGGQIEHTKAVLRTIFSQAEWQLVNIRPMPDAGGWRGNRVFGIEF